MTSHAFGIDLSGYGTGRSACIAAVLDEAKLRLIALSGTPFDRKWKGTAKLAPIVKAEREFLLRLLRRSRVAVDIPIDIDRLLAPNELEFVWQLTARPIDKALGALKPLADRIGFPTARFRNILGDEELAVQLGQNLLETYPGGSRRLLKGIERNKVVALEASVFNTLTEDEIDAAICAISALPQYSLAGAELCKLVKDTLGQDISEGQLPRGYVLLRQVPELPIVFERREAEAYLEEA